MLKQNCFISFHYLSSGGSRIRVAGISSLCLCWKYGCAKMSDSSVCQEIYPGHLMDVGKQSNPNQH